MITRKKNTRKDDNVLRKVRLYRHLCVSLCDIGFYLYALSNIINVFKRNYFLHDMSHKQNDKLKIQHIVAFSNACNSTFNRT